MFAATPNRAARVRPLGGLPLLVALLLALLQAGTPFAHALLHAAIARAEFRQSHTASQPEFHGTLLDERTCPLCAANETPALPGPRPSIAMLQTTRAPRIAVLARDGSSRPLDVFCRPPPAV